MKYSILIVCISYFFFLSSCVKDTEQPETIEKSEELFIQLNFNDASYKLSNLSNNNYAFREGGGSLICNFEKDIISGYRSMLIENRKTADQIESASIILKKWIPKGSLNLSDESSYIKQVLYSDKVGLPTWPEGFMEQYDEVSGLGIPVVDGITEAHLKFITTDGYYYTSTNRGVRDREESSFFKIEKIVENSANNLDHYHYIIEGTFKIDMFKQFKTSTVSEVETVEGSFRWPILEVRNSEMIDLCSG